MPRAFAVLGVLLLVAPAVPGGATAQDQLRHDLDAIFNTQAVDHAQWGIKITSLKTGDVLFSHDAQRFLVPASNQKLLTTAAAAARLGWDYHFTTRVLATGPVGADGLLSGNLIITSNGDPTINTRHPARWRAFEDWAKTLAAKGIRIVSGDIIGDDNAFAEPGWGAGWAWDNLQYGYGAPVSALQFNENQIELLIGPGKTPGARARIATTPPGSGIFIDHRVDTVAAGEPTRVDIARVPGSEQLQVFGQIAVDSRGLTTTASVHNPTLFYLNAFREALSRHGIFVAGGSVDIDVLPVAPDITQATELVLDQSPPLSEIVDVTMKWSRNLYAESLLLALAPPGEPATGARGLEVVAEVLKQWSIEPDAYLPRDGSGLSRYDYVTADMLTQLLSVVWRDPKLIGQFRASLPEAGVSGLLAQRLQGTAAEKRVWAKTGTLSNVRALSGYLMTVGDEPIVFSIIANNYRLRNAEIDDIVDKAILRLVRFRR